MRILILGGSGLIGAAVVGALLQRGHEVTGLARTTAPAARRMPTARWTVADIAGLSRPEQWQSLLKNIDVVVNCAGALQDGARDDVAALQDAAMQALYRAASAGAAKLIVQVSAHTEGAAAATRFLSTKRKADEALKASGLAFVILRPALVVGRNAHGGSSLVRALAAFPLVTPLVHGDAPIQVAALDDVAQLVADAVEGAIAPGTDIDIAAETSLTLEDTVAMHRAWLGLPPAPAVRVPGFVANLFSRAADALGHLGWNSPLRSTAMLAASGGITASAAQPPVRPLLSLRDTLAKHPAGVQDLWFARLYFLKPLVLGTLSLFWILSGIIALYRIEPVIAFVTAHFIAEPFATPLAVASSLVDIALGIGVAIRRFAAKALLGMVGVSLGYLLALTIVAPALWTDPWGPLVKVLPSLVLALVARAMLEER